MSNDCIFCKIAGGEIPAHTVYEDDEFKAILDRFPGNIGHILILPKNHVANIYEIDPEQAGRLFKLAVKLAGAMKDALDFDGLNILQNNGHAAGQTVFHFHVHLIPRSRDDNVNVRWRTLDPTAEQFEKTLEAIRDAVKSSE